MNDTSLNIVSKDAVNLRILSMMVERLKIANLGNLFLVIVTTAYLWNSWPKLHLLIWFGACLIVTVLRITLFYRAYEKSNVTVDNVGLWLVMWPLSLAITNLLWAVACIALVNSGEPRFILLAMFCFFVVITSGASSLSAHIPSFLAHASGLAVPVTIYFLVYDVPQGWLYATAIISFYSVTYLFSRSNNKNILDLVQLRLREQSLNREMTEKSRQAEQALLEKNRFLAAASHDLRQPLHSIGLLISSLRNSIKSTIKSDAILDDTQTALLALQNSFNGILDLSRLDAGVVEVNAYHFLASDLYTELLAEYHPLTDEKNIRLVIEDPDNVAFYTDPILLKRVFRNLLSNAVRYTSQGHITLTFGLDEDESKIRANIVDTGIGIDQEKQEEIFFEYFQISNPERDRNRGFGLGLSIVRRMCKLLGVPISLESKLGKGSNFQLLVERGDPSKCREPAKKLSGLVEFSKLKILLVDDDEGVRRAVSFIISSWGCQCVTAEGKDQAINVVNDQNFVPDIILSDYRLRNLETGPEVIEAICDELNESIPAIVITGETLPEKVRDIEENGLPILYKPVNEDELRLKISEMALQI